jgi:hypothetical protein
VDDILKGVVGVFVSIIIVKLYMVVANYVGEQIGFAEIIKYIWKITKVLWKKSDKTNRNG